MEFVLQITTKYEISFQLLLYLRTVDRQKHKKKIFFTLKHVVIRTKTILNANVKYRLSHQDVAVQDF